MGDSVSRANERADPQYRWSDRHLDRDEQYTLRRQAILRIAAQAFNETSYHTTTLDDLARRLKVTKPTLYHYVKDKDEILFECQRMAFEYLRDALEEAENATTPGIEKLSRFLARYAELIANDFGACLVRTGLKPLKPESREKLSAFASQLDLVLRRIIAQGIEDGSIRHCDPKLAAHAIFGGFNGIALWYQPGGPLGTAEIGAQFLDLFLRGLATEGGAPRPEADRSRDCTCDHSKPTSSGAE